MLLQKFMFCSRKGDRFFAAAVIFLLSALRIYDALVVSNSSCTSNYILHAETIFNSFVTFCFIISNDVDDACFFFGWTEPAIFFFELFFSEMYKKNCSVDEFRVAYVAIDRPSKRGKVNIVLWFIDFYDYCRRSLLPFFMKSYFFVLINAHWNRIEASI